MVYSYTNTEQSVAANGNILFNNDSIKTGCTVIHTPGTATFQLVRSGYYYVTLTATASATATGTDAITIQFFNGSNAIVGATNSAVSTDDGDIVEITVNAIVKVDPSCCIVNNNVNLIAVNTGVAANYQNVSLTITKIA